MGLVLNGSTQVGKIALVLPVRPFTIAMWVRNDDATAPIAATEYCWSAADSTIEYVDEGLGGSFRTSSKARTLDEGATGFVTLDTANNYVGDTWALMLHIFTSATDREVVLDGDWANRGDDSTTNMGAAPDWDTITLGAYFESSLDPEVDFWDGALAAFCVWDIAFTEAMSDTLWNSGTPRRPNLTQSGDIIQYSEMYDDGVSETGNDVTLVASPSYDGDDHPYSLGSPWNYYAQQ